MKFFSGYQLKHLKDPYEKGKAKRVYANDIKYIFKITKASYTVLKFLLKYLFCNNKLLITFKLWLFQNKISQFLNLYYIVQLR